MPSNILHNDFLSNIEFSNADVILKSLINFQDVMLFRCTCLTMCKEANDKNDDELKLKNCF